MSKESFALDANGSLRFKSPALKKLVQCLLEGLTRKIPALNYLKFVFEEAFKKVNMQQI
jgi:hypothetical protein